MGIEETQLCSTNRNSPYKNFRKTPKTNPDYTKDEKLRMLRNHAKEKSQPKNKITLSEPKNFKIQYFTIWLL